MRPLLLLAVFLGPPAAAQSDPPAKLAAATITSSDILRRIEIIAADSMQGRATPSPGLERTAGYVASEFQRMGLEPAGGMGGYTQRLGVVRWTVDTAASSVTLTAGGARNVAQVGADARYVLGNFPDQPVRGEVMLIAAPDSSAVLAGRDVWDRIVLLVVDFSRPLAANLNSRIAELAAAGPRAVIILSNRDSTTFARRLADAARPRMERQAAAADTGAVVVELHERALDAVLRQAKIDPAPLRRPGTTVRRLLPGLAIELRLAKRVFARGQVPNVIGVLEGSDSLLRNEYLVYSAHIDHIGMRAGEPDSINNGADDNASGVAGLLELAQAFRQPGVRPRRSILFLAPSAEEDGLLGSAHFTEHPPVPLSRIVANINMDLIGRNWQDSVIAVGLEQTDLGATLRSVVAAHPELRMTPIADRWPEERIFYRSDHYNFARKGVPFLFFTSGTHPDYHQPTDEASRIDVEKQARLVQLLFYLGTRIADTMPRPKWDAASYRQIVERR